MSKRKEPIPIVAVSVAEAAQMLGIDESTFREHVYPYVLSGTILSVTLGRRRCILRHSLEAWLQRRAEEEAAGMRLAS